MKREGHSINRKADGYPLDNLIVQHYVDKSLSPKQVAMDLNQLGHPITENQVIVSIRRKKVVRAFSDELKRPGHYPKKQCKSCGEGFFPTSTKHIFCKTCVPNHKASGLIYNFGISMPEYELLLKQQQNACALCHRSFEGLSSRQILVDHNHQTEDVRGILCARCNTFMGVVDAHDGEQWLEKAKQYKTKCAFKPIWKRDER